MTDDDDEVEKVKLPSGKTADGIAIPFPRPDLVLDDWEGLSEEPEAIYDGNAEGLRRAAAELLRRRQTQK